MFYLKCTKVLELTESKSKDDILQFRFNIKNFSSL